MLVLLCSAAYLRCLPATTCFGCHPSKQPFDTAAYRQPPAHPPSQRPYLSRYSSSETSYYLPTISATPPPHFPHTSLLNIHKIYLLSTSHPIPSSRCCCCSLLHNPRLDLIDYRPLAHLPNFYRVGLMILSSVWVLALCNLCLHSSGNRLFKGELKLLLIIL